MTSTVTAASPAAPAHLGTGLLIPGTCTVSGTGSVPEGGGVGGRSLAGRGSLRRGVDPGHVLRGDAGGRRVPGRHVARELGGAGDGGDELVRAGGQERHLAGGDERSGAAPVHLAAEGRQVG